MGIDLLVGCVDGILLGLAEVEGSGRNDYQALVRLFNVQDQ